MKLDVNKVTTVILKLTPEEAELLASALLNHGAEELANQLGKFLLDEGLIR